MLGDYLARAAATPWAWGEHDCCTHAGDWAITWGQGDPMEEWRGRYHDEAGARAFIADAGGLVHLWRRGLDKIGARPVADPSAGDVGVIIAIGMDGQPEHVGAVFTGRRWSFRAQAGLIVASAEVVAAWGPR